MVEREGEDSSYSLSCIRRNILCSTNTKSHFASFNNSQPNSRPSQLHSFPNHKSYNLFSASGGAGGIGKSSGEKK